MAGLSLHFTTKNPIFRSWVVFTTHQSHGENHCVKISQESCKLSWEHTWHNIQLIKPPVNLYTTHQDEGLSQRWGVSRPSRRREGAQTEGEGNWVVEHEKYRITKMDKLATERESSPSFTSLLTLPSSSSSPQLGHITKKRKNSAKPPHCWQGEAWEITRWRHGDQALAQSDPWIPANYKKKHGRWVTLLILEQQQRMSWNMCGKYPSK